MAMVREAVASLRSAMVRNAMLCLQDMFRCLPSNLVLDGLPETAESLLLRSGSDKKFIHDAARRTLEVAAGHPQLSEGMLLATGEWVGNCSVGVSATAVEVFVR